MSFVKVVKFAGCSSNLNLTIFVCTKIQNIGQAMFLLYERRISVVRHAPYSFINSYADIFNA